MPSVETLDILPTESVTPTVRIENDNGFPRTKNVGPHLGTPPPAETQRSSEAFQSLQLHTAQWYCRKLLPQSEAKPWITSHPALRFKLQLIATPSVL